MDGTLTFTQSDGNSNDFTALSGLGLTHPQVAGNVLSGVTLGTQYGGLSVLTLGRDMRLGWTVPGAVPASGSGLILLARFDAAGNGYGFETDAAVWFINRYDAGVATQLATGSFTSTANDTYTIEIIDQKLRCFINGTQVGGDQVASSYTTNTKFGVFLLRQAGTLTVDNLTYTDFGSVYDPRSSAMLWHPRSPRRILRELLPAAPSSGVDLRQGSAVAHVSVWASVTGSKIAQDGSKASIAVGAKQSGSKLASGSAVAAVGVSAKEAGSKLTSGGAVAHVAVWAKQAGSKLIDGTAKAAVSVFAKAAGNKLGQGAAKAGLAVSATEAGTKLAQGSAKAQVAVWARQAASKLTSGGAVAHVAVWAPAAGTKVGGAVEGSARAVIAVFAKAAGSKIGSGTAKAPVTITTKQAATKIAQGTAKAQVAVFARQLGAKVAQGVTRAALAVWSLVSGVGLGIGPVITGEIRTGRGDELRITAARAQPRITQRNDDQRATSPAGSERATQRADQVRTTEAGT